MFPAFFFFVCKWWRNWEIHVCVNWDEIHLHAEVLVQPCYCNCTDVSLHFSLPFFLFYVSPILISPRVVRSLDSLAPLASGDFCQESKHYSTHSSLTCYPFLIYSLNHFETLRRISASYEPYLKGWVCNFFGTSNIIPLFYIVKDQTLFTLRAVYKI